MRVFPCFGGWHLLLLAPINTGHIQSLGALSLGANRELGVDGAARQVGTRY